MGHSVVYARRQHCSTTNASMRTPSISQYKCNKISIATGDHPYLDVRLIRHSWTRSARKTRLTVDTSEVDLLLYASMFGTLDAAPGPPRMATTDLVPYKPQFSRELSGNGAQTRMEYVPIPMRCYGCDVMRRSDSGFESLTSSLLDTDYCTPGKSTEKWFIANIDQGYQSESECYVFQKVAPGDGGSLGSGGAAPGTGWKQCFSVTVNYDDSFYSDDYSSCYDELSASFFNCVQHRLQLRGDLISSSCPSTCSACPPPSPPTSPSPTPPPPTPPPPTAAHAAAAPLPPSSPILATVRNVNSTEVSYRETRIPSLRFECLFLTTGVRSSSIRFQFLRRPPVQRHGHSDDRVSSAKQPESADYPNVFYRHRVTSSTDMPNAFMSRSTDGYTINDDPKLDDAVYLDQYFDVYLVINYAPSTNIDNVINTKNITTIVYRDGTIDRLRSRSTQICLM